MPEYAEIHYKFKLPWSLLYKKEPEILIDAPFQIVPDESVKLFVVIREANRFPVFVHSLTATFSCDKERFQKEERIGESISSPFYFRSVDCGKIPPGKYEVDAVLHVQFGKSEKRIRRFNLTGLNPSPLCITVLKEPVPKPKDYLAGDTHVHTSLSADPVEFGASPAVLQQAAKAVGLDFVFCTDHSYDFAFSESDYMQRTDANARYENLQKKIAELPPYPQMIAGEEISAGNAENRNVHLLVPGNAFYIPGEGDCGRKWLNNAPTLSIANIVSQVELPCIAAHPKEPMGRLERFIFRRGEWKECDLQKNSKNPIVALEFWNGSRDKGFILGRKFWISELEKGNYILPFGGNDAHGDLNEYTGVQIPLFKLKRSHAHVFGYVRTVIQSESPRSLHRGMNLYVTNGPALWWKLSPSGATFYFKSSTDFGDLKTLCFFGKKKTEIRERQIDISATRFSDFEFSAEIPFGDYAYIRAEAETEINRFALTSACPAPTNNVHT
ncbi:PHP domain-containing protein [Fibrobacter intestinalis]|uniref:PHP domain-containing protein n=1 Tax=Fibrobacter intestinalis TaxID=28122 RepID=UPI0023F1475B|nr:hypothetical protein [Fibrobacter intestinalis]MDD7297870.1 hypothetical protein [Fibrobacter intestinalis]